MSINSLKSIKLIPGFRNSLTKKSQLIAYDFIAGFVIFMILVVLISLYWFKNAGQISNDIESDGRIKYAMEVSNVLAKTTGNPQRWELDINKSCMQGNCTLGLAEIPGVLSWDKVSAFVNLSNYNYTRARTLLGLGKYKFQFTIRDTSNNVVATTGQSPGSNLSVNARRIILINNTVYIMDYVLY